MRINTHNYRASASVSLSSGFLFNFNYYLAIPLVGFLTLGSSFEVTQIIAAVLTLKSLTELATTLLTGFFPHRRSAQIVHLAGTLFRAAALITLVGQTAGAFSPYLFAILIGIGAALCRTPSRTIAATLASSASGKTVLFRHLHIASTFGSVIGPLFAYGLSLGSGLIAILLLVGLEVLISVVQMIFIPTVVYVPKTGGLSRIQAVRQLFGSVGESSVLKIIYVQFAFWFFIGVSMSLILSIQLLNRALADLKGVLFSTEGLCAITVQAVLIGLVGKHPKRSFGLYLGFGSLVGGILAMLLFPNYVVIFASVGLIGVGEALINPIIPEAITRSARKESYATIIALTFIVESVAESTGYYAGAGLLELRTSPNTMAATLILLTTILGVALKGGYLSLPTEDNTQ